jgi:hypothetical protein
LAGRQRGCRIQNAVIAAAAAKVGWQSRSGCGAAGLPRRQNGYRNLARPLVPERNGCDGSVRNPLGSPYSRVGTYRRLPYSRRRGSTQSRPPTCRVEITGDRFRGRYICIWTCTQSATLRDGDSRLISRRYGLMGTHCLARAIRAVEGPEAARPFAPKTRPRHYLWFGNGQRKAGNRAGFREATGECRDAWFRAGPGR